MIGELGDIRPNASPRSTHPLGQEALVNVGTFVTWTSRRRIFVRQGGAFRVRVRSCRAAAKAFSARVATDLLRPGAVRRVRWHRDRGHRLVLVSASLDIYLTYLAEPLGFDDVLCTRLSRRDGIFDGRLIGINCRGAEKVARLEKLIGGFHGHQIFAYGDSDGDREMLRVADFPFYKPFRRSDDLS